MDDQVIIHPRIVPWRLQAPLDVVMVCLNTVRRHVAVRITGGCAKMSYDDGRGVLDLFAAAFGGFEGAMLVGGTRMILGDDPANVLFGITEVGPAIRRRNPKAYVLGVIPRLENFRFDHRVLKVECTAGSPDAPDHATIVHPDQDLVVAVSGRIVKDGEAWDDEVAFCEYVTNTLRSYGGWSSLLVAYNGGGVTEREIRSAATRGWPVLLIRGSGRKTDELAQDAAFLAAHPNVAVCDKTVASMRRELVRLHVLSDSE